MLGLPAILVYSMAISYCNEAHVHSLYGESEITSLISQAPSIFAVRILPGTESWAGVWEQNLLIWYSGSESCLPVIKVVIADCM